MRTDNLEIISLKETSIILFMFKLIFLKNNGISFGYNQ